MKYNRTPALPLLPSEALPWASGCEEGNYAGHCLDAAHQLERLPL